MDKPSLSEEHAAILEQLTEALKQEFGSLLNPRYMALDTECDKVSTFCFNKMMELTSRAAIQRAFGGQVNL
jgi:hypothetical protein